MKCAEGKCGGGNFTPDCAVGDFKNVEDIWLRGDLMLLTGAC